MRTPSLTPTRTGSSSSLELAKTGVPIAVVLFAWTLLRQLHWLDGTPVLVAGLLAAGLVAVRRGRRFEGDVPLADGPAGEHAHLLLATLPWLLFPLVFSDVAIAGDQFELLERFFYHVGEVGPWTAAGVVFVYVVAALAD